MIRFVGLVVFYVFLSSSAFSQLPQVYLYGTFGNEYTKGSIRIDENGETVSYDIKAKWRGHTAKAYDKKSFAVKLLDENGKSMDTSILGMRKDNNWILDAMAVDKSRMRNRVSFDLWNDFASDSYIKREYEPESFNGTHGKFVEVFLNDSYHGIYCLTEKIDRKQLKLKKYKNGVHGLLYKGDTWEGTQFWNYVDDYDNSSETWMGWESQYPDVEDDGETDWEPLLDAIKFVVNSSDYIFNNEVSERFDLPVFNDYFIFATVILAIDNWGKNTFLYVYDKETDSRVGVAPWDLDATWGRSYDSSELPANHKILDNNLYKRLYESSSMMNDVANRYIELRKTVLSEESLKERFHNYMDLFVSSGAAQRETERWSGVNDIALDFEQEKDYIDKWIEKRLIFTDKYFSKNITTGIKPENNVSAGNNGAYYLNGMKVNGNPRKGRVVVINGKKFFL